MLPTAGIMELSLWNVLGRKLTVLDESWKSTGKHRIVWDGENLPSGVYLLRLTTNHEMHGVIGKVLVLK
jgi:hypothetical protein